MGQNTRRIELVVAASRHRPPGRVAGACRLNILITRLAERFPNEVRATAGGFVYHQGAIFGGLVGPILAYLATDLQLGFAIPMLIGTTVACVSVVLAMAISPETRGTALSAELSVA